MPPGADRRSRYGCVSPSGAAASGAAFDEVRRVIGHSGAAGEEKGPIVLATVEGDIHDIGKNLVVLMLKNPLDWVTCPLPLQRRHVSGTVPGAAPVPRQSRQVSSLVMSISVDMPNADSIKDIFRS